MHTILYYNPSIVSGVNGGQGNAELLVHINQSKPSLIPYVSKYNSWHGY